MHCSIRLTENEQGKQKMRLISRSSTEDLHSGGGSSSGRIKAVKLFLNQIPGCTLLTQQGCLGRTAWKGREILIAVYISLNRVWMRDAKKTTTGTNKRRSFVLVGKNRIATTDATKTGGGNCLSLSCAA